MLKFYNILGMHKVLKRAFPVFHSSVNTTFDYIDLVSDPLEVLGIYNIELCRYQSDILLENKFILLNLEFHHKVDI